MPRVIRCGQKPKGQDSKAIWSDAEILLAYWEMEEERTGKPGPMTRAIEDLQIPELKPIPKETKYNEQ